MIADITAIFALDLLTICDNPRSLRCNLRLFSFDQMDLEPELPEVLEAEWARDQVLQLFVDLAAGVEVQHVQLRTSCEDRRASLAEAESSFVEGTARAIQVRYRFEGELWSDTILPGDPTTKIIRSRLPTLGFDGPHHIPQDAP